MQICYYPGCTLKSKAVDLDIQARKIAEKLGIEMVDIDKWQCCGAEYPTAPNETATKLSAVRALNYAKSHGGKLLTLCSACHNVLKRVNEDMRTNEKTIMKANIYLELNPEYRGETEVIHYLEMLKNVVGFDKIESMVVKPLNRKVAAYYGCLLLRPSNVMKFDNPENPTILEDLIVALGGTPVKYSHKNECCGAYVSIKSPDLAKKKSQSITDDAKAFGADELITACPLCYYNLKKNCGENLQISYFTALMMEALGIDG